MRPEQIQPLLAWLPTFDTSPIRTTCSPFKGTYNKLKMSQNACLYTEQGLRDPQALPSLHGRIPLEEPLTKLVSPCERGSRGSGSVWCSHAELMSSAKERLANKVSSRWSFATRRSRMRRNNPWYLSCVHGVSLFGGSFQGLGNKVFIVSSWHHDVLIAAAVSDIRDFFFCCSHCHIIAPHASIEP